MALLASEVKSEVLNGLLNDPNGAIYSDTPLYAVMNKAYRELQTKLSALGIGVTKEINAAVAVTAGTTALTDGGGLPTGLLYPVYLSERAEGATTPFTEMSEMDWEPSDLVPRTELVYWAWREDQIKFVGATTNREVLVRYVKTIGTISGDASPILINDCFSWLAQRTAVVAAVTIGGNPSRSDALAADLVEIWDDFKATMVKRKQTIPVRRMRTRYRRP